MNIQDAVFLITGGASGLGAATARRVVKAGGKVVLADLNTANGTALAEELGVAALYVHTDVADEDSTRAAIDHSLTHFGTLHGLICCAGVAPGEKVLGKDGAHALSTFTRGIMINLVGTFNAIRLAAEAMSKNAPNVEGERGVIITTASVAAFDGQIGQAAYSASKAGVVGMTLPIARELARFGIRVMTIAPGIFETPMLLGLPQDVQASLGKTVPFPSRLGRGDEFAQLVESIVQNPMLNGEVIRLDGALRMASK
ncbi:3-hydroxyacyl-CoA dehydrogenase [Pseudomonas sp. R5(2019)]|uniref:3-hydroxyacyl-CoA dehydrogenase n=1 Tax=Pseudomonas sp. R5(2019) TaxID=2697566 RepID=UPI00141352E4|nr:3-hydroxyacyl-CoA dehydrogenase [Pseudomonas sp. R5(2019)]NBA97614.1 SDR family NAD(P)-dependent oxidoreductase [Pseudomonas sp. R5(2019)]